MTLVDFLLARIAEDEDVARSADESNRSPWRHDGGQKPVWNSTGQAVMLHPAPSAGVHIARHDPTRVLAECAAKRAIVELSQWGLQHDRNLGDDCCGSFDPDHNAGLDAGDVLRHLAGLYATHPDYDEAWRLT